VPGAEILSGCERYELIDDVRQIPGKQLRFQDGEEFAGINRPLAPQYHARCIKRLPRRASPGNNEYSHSLKGSRVRCICGKLKEAVDKDRAEQLRRAPRRIDDLTSGPGILGAQRLAPGIGMIDAVQSISEITNDVPFASKKLTTTLTTLTIPTVPLIRRTINRCFPVRLLSDAPFHSGGQRRY
jgi:hypothetical protein